MALMVVSTGEDGRSKVVSRDPAEGSSILWQFDASALEVPAVEGDAADIGVAPGHGVWRLLRPAPGTVGARHYTLTMDIYIVLEGSAELLLDDGPLALTQGDHVRCEGAAHGWRWGDDGCTLTVLNLGAVARSAG